MSKAAPGDEFAKAFPTTKASLKALQMKFARQVVPPRDSAVITSVVQRQNAPTAHTDVPVETPPGQISNRIYIRRFSGTELGIEPRRLVADGFQMAAIGPSSLHAEAFILPNGSDRLYKVALGAPLVGDFKGPFTITAAMGIDAPLEVLFYKNAPRVIGDKRNPVDLLVQDGVWRGGDRYVAQPFTSGTQNMSTFVIAGRRKWWCALVTSAAAGMNFTFAFTRFLTLYNSTTEPLVDNIYQSYVVFPMGFVDRRVFHVAQGEVFNIDSDEFDTYGSGYDTVAVMNLDTNPNSFWNVQVGSPIQTGSYVYFHAED